MRETATNRVDYIMRTPCEQEMVRLDDLAFAQRPPVRVAIHAITEAAPKFGSRVYLWELASALARIDGIDLVLLVGRGQRNEVPLLLRSRARELSISASRSYLQIFRQKQIREALLREKIDFYHVPNTMPLLERAIPTAVTIHDLAELRVKKYGILRTTYRFLVNLLAAHLADRVVTVSENSKRDIVRLLRIPESKVTVVYNGVSEEFRPLNRRDCKDYLESKYSITSDFLLAPGGLSRNKNIPKLLAAMRMLKERARRESLVLFGDKEDPEFERVSAGVRRLGLNGIVLLPGFVPREDLPPFYNAASLVVYPTLCEGFGLPVLEAMACGTPVVTSNSSSLPEVAGDAAMLVDPTSAEQIADAAELLLSDPGLREKFRSRGISRARGFTWERAANKMLETFQGVLARHRDSEKPRSGQLSPELGPSAKYERTEARKGMKANYGPTTQEMQRAWNQMAIENAERHIASERDDWTESDFFASGERDVVKYLDPILRRHACDARNKKILEIGCGIGRMSFALAKRFAEVAAVDVSEEMVQRAVGYQKKFSVSNVRFYLGSGNDLSQFGPGQFDFCFSYIVFQHIPSAELIFGYVREIGRVLKPGGSFLFQVNGYPHIRFTESIYLVAGVRNTGRLRKWGIERRPFVRFGRLDLMNGAPVRHKAMVDECRAAGLTTKEIIGARSQYTWFFGTKTLDSAKL